MLLMCGMSFSFETPGEGRDEGLCEAAMDNGHAQAFVSVLTNPAMMGKREAKMLAQGATLSFTPVSNDDYAASFKFWPIKIHSR